MGRIKELKKYFTDKNYRSLMLTFIGLVGVFFIIVGALFVMFMGSFGWFAKNHEVSGAGMAVQPGRAEPTVTLYEVNSSGTGFVSRAGAAHPDELTVDLGIPGTSKLFLVEISNTCDFDFTVSYAALAAPEASDEVCISESGLSYWFSSQLEIRSAFVSSSASLPSIAEVNTALSGQATVSSSGVAVTSSGTPLAPSSLHGTSSGTRPSGEVPIYVGSTSVPKAGNKLYIAVVVTFVNRNYDQSIYIDFGKSGSPCCKRRIAVEFE